MSAPMPELAARDVEIVEGVGCDFAALPGPALVAFGMWHCHCTTIAATLDEIPVKCPIHGRALLARPSWEDNPHRVPLHAARPSVVSSPEERK